ncbi:MAG: Pr6Pr family membrane protein [Armatimonas sp.]
MRSKTLRIAYKVFFGLLGFSAIVTELATVAERGKLNPVNFFSYFTIQNNLLMVVVFLLSALYMAAGKSPRWLDTLRGAAGVYILVVGIAFSVLLAGRKGVGLTAVFWDNTVLHYLIPLAALLDLMLDLPQHKLRFSQSLLWLLYPVAYLAYSLIRGAITGWYPYPFLNPHPNGYGAIALVALGLLILTLLLVWGVCWLSGQLLTNGVDTHE